MRFLPRFSFAWFFVAIVCVCALTGCAGGRKAEAIGSVPAPAEAVADSLRAKFQMTMMDAEGKSHDFDAVLFSVPGKRYRLEITGPMGIGVASLLWTDEGWTMVFPTEKLYMKGRGYMVGLLNTTDFPLVNIHQVAGFFNGEYLPAGTKPESARDSSGLRIAAAVDPLGVKFEYGEREGDVEFISRKGRDGKMEMLRFLERKDFEGRSLASKIAFDRDGARYLELRLKKVNHGKSFSLGTWRLNVPRSYKPVGE